MGRANRPSSNKTGFDPLRELKEEGLPRGWEAYWQGERQAAASDQSVPRAILGLQDHEIDALRAGKLGHKDILHLLQRADNKDQWSPDDPFFKALWHSESNQCKKTLEEIGLGDHILKGNLRHSWFNKLKETGNVYQIWGEVLSNQSETTTPEQRAEIFKALRDWSSRCRALGDDDYANWSKDVLLPAWSTMRSESAPVAEDSVQDLSAFIDVVNSTYEAVLSSYNAPAPKDVIKKIKNSRILEDRFQTGAFYQDFVSNISRSMIPQLEDGNIISEGNIDRETIEKQIAISTQKAGVRDWKKTVYQYLNRANQLRFREYLNQNPRIGNLKRREFEKVFNCLGDEKHTGHWLEWIEGKKDFFELVAEVNDQEARDNHLL